MQIVPKVLFDTTVTKMMKMVTHVIKKQAQKQIPDARNDADGIITPITHLFDEKSTF